MKPPAHTPGRRSPHVAPKLQQRQHSKERSRLGLRARGVRIGGRKDGGGYLTLGRQNMSRQTACQTSPSLIGAGADADAVMSRLELCSARCRDTGKAPRSLDMSDHSLNYREGVMEGVSAPILMII